MLTALAIVGTIVALLCAVFAVRTFLIIRQYGPPIRRIFDESPLFAPTEGIPHPQAEDVEFKTPDKLTLRGSYLAAAGTPKGVVVFCHEFLSDRWSGMSYWEFLQRDGFDIFTFDFRSHGTSDKDPVFKPRHWVTNYELIDLQAAVDYLARRSAGAQLPIGLYGISRGGGAAIGVAARDTRVRCVVTDGAFPTHSTMLTYMNKWMRLVVGDKWWVERLPDPYLGFIRDRVLAGVERDSHCRFARLERAIRRLAPRPILMIHGGRDSYIRPDIAKGFFECAREPREFWVVPGARHNRCLETAEADYQRRVLEFFRANLAGSPAQSSAAEPAAPSQNSVVEFAKRSN